MLSINEARGFPGMIGSIDWRHWELMNYLFAWQGKYSRHDVGCTIIF
jgi:hypothetical protein